MCDLLFINCENCGDSVYVECDMGQDVICDDCEFHANNEDN